MFESFNRKAHPDEKGTERCRFIALITARNPIIARPIPMKRELKANLVGASLPCHLCIARPIPMKRELKGVEIPQWLNSNDHDIARPIPMKRELKDRLG